MSAWCWLNVLPGVGSLTFIAMGKRAPGLRMRFASEEIGSIESRAPSTVDGLATLLNALIAINCVTFFFVVRKSVLRKERWSLFTLGFGALILQAIACVSDHFFFLSKNTLVINVSSVLLLTGFGLSVIGLLKNKVEPGGAGNDGKSPRLT